MPRIICKSLDEARNLIQRIAELEIRATGLMLEKTGKLNAVEQEYAPMLSPVTEERDALRQVVLEYISNNKKIIFAEGVKSMRLGVGVIGLRESSKLEPCYQYSEDEVLELLEKHDLTEAIKRKFSIDKTAMKKWSDEKLELVGMHRVTADTPYLDLARGA